MKKLLLVLAAFFLTSLNHPDISRADFGGQWAGPVMLLAQRLPDAPRPTLREGIAQYEAENYEEAIDILLLVRNREPQSPAAAYFLGMAYKQAQDFPAAATHLEAAAKLRPPVREAFVELIDVLIQTDRLAEARQWIDRSKAENVSPSRVFFLEGLLLAKENRRKEATAAFESAKQAEPALRSAADFQIALLDMRERDYAKARDRLQIIVREDPLSDLAAFARTYLDSLEDAIHRERPLRLTVSLMGAYDSNMVQKPLESIVAGGITNEKAYVLNSSARLDFVPRLPGPWMFQASYSFASALHSKNTHSHDSLANSLSLSPGYDFGRFTVNLLFSYTNALLRTDPDIQPSPDSRPGYKRYLDLLTAGVSVRYMLNNRNLIEYFLGYDNKDFSNQKVNISASDRDSEGLRTYLSWVWLFRENAFLNLRYEYTFEKARGIWWENQGNRLGANVIYPLLAGEPRKKAGQLNLQAGLTAFFQNYRHDQPYLDKEGFIRNATRRDQVYTGLLGLNYNFNQWLAFLIQYTHTTATSNMPTNEYKRDQIGAGIELRF